MTSRALKGAKPKIKAPKKHGPNISVDETWAKLSTNIVEILNRRAEHLSFEENHRYAYNLVLYKAGDTLYKGTCKLLAENLEKLAEEDIKTAFPTGSSGDLVQRSQEGETLLKAVRKVWDDHTTALSRLSDVLRYMDRVYTANAGVPQIWEAGLLIFLERIIRPPIEDHIISAILTQIQADRDGYTINGSAVKGCVDIFLALRERDQAVTIYSRDLEPAVLRESESFYKAEGERLLEIYSATDYLRKVEARFQSEDARTHYYLPLQTNAPLSRILENHLLSSPHLSSVISMSTGLDSMIDGDKVDDLSRLYRLFSRVPAGLPILRKALRESIIRRGQIINAAGPGTDRDMVEDEVETGAKGKGKAKARPTPATQLLSLALKWVDDVLNLKDKLDKIWSDAFKRDQDLGITLNEAFEAFINLNERSAEFISLFIDDHLKKGLKGKTELEVDAILDKTITVFRFITDKDVFERHYKNHLAKRLLHGRSVSDDAERGMLAKLKVECGTQFTQRMEGMFHDMKISAETMQAYREYLSKTALSEPPDIDISVTIMTSTFWPMPAAPPTCTFPGSLARSAKSFEQFYFSRHTGRRLTWMPSLGNADLRVTFRSGKSHEVNVSTMAMVILLLFEDLSDSDTLTYEDIKTATSIPEAELQRQLQSLACGKHRILKKHPSGRDVNPSDSFSFNAEFSSPLFKIKISTITSRVETAEERKETHDRVDEERRYQMEACIVRIMKDRKHMTHNDLVNEVTRQLTSRFSPNPLDIKKRIEVLIEREYLERCEDRKSYNYLVCPHYDKVILLLTITVVLA
ncbi:Cullin-domain-containing protein [Panus rudis PR-1116 ss-1]|nr:Cullin-domain-containing protein [Panus rudis PR-1116 ss-1]